MAVHGDGRYARILRGLTSVQLLILDDWGLESPRLGARRDLCEIIEERYGRRSAILTSQIPSTNGRPSPATRPVPTPSSTTSFTTPIASISPATASGQAQINPKGLTVDPQLAKDFPLVEAHRTADIISDRRTQYSGAERPVPTRQRSESLGIFAWRQHRRAI
jgi:hypothetical protein